MKLLKLTLFFVTLVSLALMPSFLKLGNSQAASQKSTGKRKPLMMAVKRAPNEFRAPSAKEIAGYNGADGIEGRRAVMLKKFDAEFQTHNAPFNINLLTARDWKEKLAMYPEFGQGLESRQITTDKMKGVVMADTLYMPAKMTLDGDTLIIANRMVFEGQNVLIKGPYDINLYIVNDTLTTLPVEGARQGKIRAAANTPEFETEFFARNQPVRGKITVDTSGPGNKEWLEMQEFNLANGLTTIDTSGAPGANGDIGTFGNNGTHGDDYKRGKHGSCYPTVDPDGEWGHSGDDGTGAEDGGEGEEGGDGDDAGGINQSVGAGTGDWEFLARGGRGGDGGPGGWGGIGGNGGDAGSGGNGTTCGCQVGVGGDGGNGGDAGDGGDGKDGGPGGDGGDGGDVIVTFAANWVGNATYNVDKGGKGFGGDKGYGQAAGIIGEGGNGGSPGAAACSNFGTPGDAGDDGWPGIAGQHGDDGADGADGIDGSYTPYTEPVIIGGGGGCGGGCCFARTAPDMEPGTEGCGCTPYYWVYYVSWDGGNTWEIYDMWYAGCW